MLRITEIGNRFFITCMVIGAMVVGSVSAALASPVSSDLVVSDDELEHMGYIEAMPADGGAGTWVIGGETFTADENTEFETDEGALEVGACAEVEYEAGADGNLALEIEGEDSPNCIDDEDDDMDEDDDEDAEDMDDDAEDDVEDEDGASESTEGGNAADGSSAADAGRSQVFLMSNVSGAAQDQDPPDAGSSDTEDEDADDDMDEDEEDEEDDEDALELMGLVESMPAGGSTGTWVIGGEAFSADENTEFDTEEGALEVGACAEVEYEAGADGNLALEIEGEDSPDCIDDEEDEDDADEDDDMDDDVEDADESGTSESTDGGNAANVGDADSAANLDGAEIRLMSNVSGADQNQDPPGTGDNEAEDPNDAEDDDADDEDEADDDEDGDEEDENEVFGTIEIMPAGGDAPLGTWVVDGVSYVATPNTEIEEEYGPFQVGANVELEFEVVNGVNQLIELETEPAPGEAPNTTEGLINSKSGSGAVVAASFSGNTAAEATWVIGNKEYTVTGITAQEGALTVGSMAQVNSYTHADGREIATLIRNVDMPSQNSFLYLPIVLQHG